MKENNTPLKATELRIGNWYRNRIDSHAKYMQITANDILNIEESEAELGQYYGIPLTEDWLKRFGFEKGPMSYSKNIDLFNGWKRLTFSGDYLYVVDSEKQNTMPTDIITLWNKDVMKEFYVHQLQNLFFTLTNTELTIK